MATFTITIPDDKVQDVLDAFANQYNYQEQVPNPDYDPDVPASEETVPNPISKASFAKGTVRAFVKNVYIAYKATEIDEQRAEAIETANSDIDTVTVE